MFACGVSVNSVAFTVGSNSADKALFEAETFLIENSLPSLLLNVMGFMPAFSSFRSRLRFLGVAATLSSIFAFKVSSDLGFLGSLLSMKRCFFTAPSTEEAR